jgi:hypothetical protein
MVSLKDVPQKLRHKVPERAGVAEKELSKRKKKYKKVL